MTSGMPTKTDKVFETIVKFAQSKKTPTYKDISSAVHLHWRTQIPLRLYAIWQWCENKHIPHLNAIVVNKKSKLPGKGYTPNGQQLTKTTFPLVRDNIFNFDWNKVKFP